MDEIVSAISTVGFPIICTLILAWVVYDMNEKMNAQMAGFIKAIDGNTKAISELAVLIRDKDGDSSD